MKKCDNKRSCHKPEIVEEDSNAMRVICTECKNQFIIRKDWRGVPENRMYSLIYKRDILQGNDNLFYKYYPDFLSK